MLFDVYAQKTALRLGVSSESVRAEFAKFGVQGTKLEVEEAETQHAVSEVSPPSPHEFWLLKLLFLHEELARWASVNLDPNWIQHPFTRQIVTARIDAQRNETWSSLGAFLDECESPEMKSLITECATEERTIPDPDQQLADVTLKLRNLFVDRQMMALAQRINHPETDDAIRSDLLREQQELRQLKRQPLSPAL